MNGAVFRSQAAWLPPTHAWCRHPASLVTLPLPANSHALVNRATIVLEPVFWMRKYTTRSEGPSGSVPFSAAAVQAMIHHRHRMILGPERLVQAMTHLDSCLDLPPT